MLFALAPICGRPALGARSCPGAYGAHRQRATSASAVTSAATGPPPDYRRRRRRPGRGGASVVLARRRPLTWLLVFLAAWSRSGSRSAPTSLGGPAWLGHLWLPWRDAVEAAGPQGDPAGPVRAVHHAVRRLPARRRPRCAVRPLPAGRRRGWRRTGARSRRPPRPRWRSLARRARLRDLRRAARACVPVQHPAVPAHRGADAAGAAPWCSPSPSPSRASTQPMLWQAVDDMHFRPGRRRAQDARRPRAARSGQGPPGSARRILTDLTIPRARPCRAGRRPSSPPCGTPCAPGRWTGSSSPAPAATPSTPRASSPMALGVAPALRARRLGVDAAAGGSRPRTPAAGGVAVASAGPARGRAAGAARAAGHGALRPRPRPAAPERGRAVVGSCMQPILHLSIPVRDMDEARDFYVHTLGCQPARARADFTDVWFFGMQVTLQDRPDEATGLAPGRLAALRRDARARRVRRADRPPRARAASTGSSRSRPTTRACRPSRPRRKIADPSGNVIELKTYRDVEAALEISTHSYPEAFAHGQLSRSPTVVAYGVGPRRSEFERSAVGETRRERGSPARRARTGGPSTSCGRSASSATTRSWRRARCS